MKWTVLYLGSVLLVNAMFILLPPFVVGGQMMTWGSFVVGGTLVIRDYADAEVGKKVLWATLAGTLVTALMSPGLAIASGCAFLVSELCDFATYRLAGGSFRRRVVISSLVSAPIDSLIFMTLAGFFSWGGVAVMTASKLVALVFVARRSA